MVATARAPTISLASPLVVVIRISLLLMLLRIVPETPQYNNCLNMKRVTIVVNLEQT